MTADKSDDRDLPAAPDAAAESTTADQTTAEQATTDQTTTDQTATDQATAEVSDAVEADGAEARDSADADADADADSDGDDPDGDESDGDDSDSGTEPDIDPGDTLFYEPGGSWWVVAIGPVLVGAVLIMEIAGPGSVHWPIMLIFLAILVGFSVVQVSAARRHVSVELTETTLRQGAKRIRLDEIARIYPVNNDPTAKDWESAPALGELHGVPRRRTGVGVKLTSGKIAQAWARDVDRFRSELTTAHQAIELGLPPRGRHDS